MTQPGPTFSPAMREATNYYRWIIDRFRPYVGSNILEVGVGCGQILPHLAGDFRYVGVDIDAKLLESLQSQGDPRCRVVLGDIQSPEFVGRVADVEVDTAVCFNVLEHLNDDAQAVVNLLDVLRPGGHLLLLVPAFPLLYNDMDALAGHRRRYVLDDVRKLVPPNRGSIVFLSYFNPLGWLGWLVNKAVKHRSLEESSAINGQIRFFDRYLLPISRLLDPLMRRFLGQSVACVVKKAGP